MRRSQRIALLRARMRTMRLPPAGSGRHAAGPDVMMAEARLPGCSTGQPGPCPERLRYFLRNRSASRAIRGTNNGRSRRLS